MKISVMIPTMRRDELLLGAVRSLAAQTVLPDELLVIDDGEIMPSTMAAITAACAERGIAFRYFKKDQPGLAESKNVGAQMAEGDVICCLDDDIILAPDYLAELRQAWAAHWDDATVAGIGGVFNGHRPVGRLERLLDRIFSLAPLSPKKTWSILPWGFQTFDYGLVELEEADWMPGGNSSLRAAIAKRYAFAPLQPGRTALEDIDYGWRLAKDGYRLLMTGRVRMRHLESPVGRERAKLSGFKEGSNRIFLYRKHGERTRLNDARFALAAIGSIGKKLMAAAINRERAGAYLRQAVGLAEGYLSGGRRVRE
jgi:glycosyltransferase involved in cell wall biosynthesis